MGMVQGFFVSGRYGGYKDLRRGSVPESLTKVLLTNSSSRLSIRKVRPFILFGKSGGRYKQMGWIS